MTAGWIPRIWNKGTPETLAPLGSLRRQVRERGSSRCPTKGTAAADTGDTSRTDATGCLCFSASFFSVHFYGLKQFHICSLPTPPRALFFEHILQ